MIQVQLSPEVEAHIQAQARAQGIEAASYLRNLIEDAGRATPITSRRPGAPRDMEAFFAAAHGIPYLLTLNQPDFLRYANVDAIHPGQIQS
ncbi:MAG TPA: hypothetical protein VGG97_05260 [Bryobacteraceae bacterium]|jgi:hypothetical protein